MFAIKKMRERANLSQKEVADALGVKKPRYGDWERETTQINLRDAIRLADLFGCTLDELAGRDFPAASLTPEEGFVLEAYRSSNAQGRAAIEAVAASQSGMEGKPKAASSDPAIEIGGVA